LKTAHGTTICNVLVVYGSIIHKVFNDNFVNFSDEGIFYISDKLVKSAGTIDAFGEQ
jgi:hypothetical protein